MQILADPYYEWTKGIRRSLIVAVDRMLVDK